MSHKIVMSPKMPDPILDMARAMLPAGYDLEVVDQSDPKFATAMLDADFFLGFARGAHGTRVLPGGAEAQADPAHQRRL